MTYPSLPGTTTVEAASLSAITAVASNPPFHPQAPVPPPGLPLTLYIARVPGSRDVFLTPMKPRDRNVTAEDIQSSLYYVHLNSDDDRGVDEVVIEARRTLDGVDEESAAEDLRVSPLVAVGENGIRRKPIDAPARVSMPVSPPYPTDDWRRGFNGSLPSPPKSPLIARKPVLPSRNNGLTPNKAQSPVLPDIPRRPLPTNRLSLHEDNVRLLRRSEHNDENNPYLRDYRSSINAVSQAETTTAPDCDAGALTLIRRDPASSEQWNVASIHDPPVQDISSAALLSPPAARLTKKGGAPLYLDITNPGYTQFVDRDSRPVSRTSTSTDSSDGAPEGTFRRRMYMPGSRFGEHGYGHRKQKSVDSLSSGERERAMHSQALAQLSGDRRPATTDRRIRGYAFTSPWGGTCDFSTGAAGKSLKCKHTSADRGTADVSELRFNLPTSSRNTKTMSTMMADKRSSYFAHMRHSRREFDFDEDCPPEFVINDDGRVDLTLGQERAGGGFRGRQAKLGKLIIEPEGLKMLDLLVAANVGLWWRAYERA